MGQILSVAENSVSPDLMFVNRYEILWIKISSYYFSSRNFKNMNFTLFNSGECYQIRVNQVCRIALLALL